MLGDLALRDLGVPLRIRARWVGVGAGRERLQANSADDEPEYHFQHDGANVYTLEPRSQGRRKAGAPGAGATPAAGVGRSWQRASGASLDEVIDQRGVVLGLPHVVIHAAR